MSWSLLFIEAFIAAVALILPGMLASRAFGVPFKLSLSFGPVISVFFLVFMGIVLRFTGAAGGYFALLISLFLFAVVSGVACYLRFHGRSAFSTPILSLCGHTCAPLSYLFPCRLISLFAALVFQIVFFRFMTIRFI